MSRRQRIRVNILAKPHTSSSTLFGLYDVLTSVGVGWETNVAGTPGEPQFDVTIVAATRERVRCAGGIPLDPQASLAEAGESDVALVSSLVTPAWGPPIECDERELDWLSREETQGAIVASACTGAMVVAEAGLLDGWEATTHWAYRDLFRVYYPEVQLRPEKNLCVSGRNNQFVTAGGSTAWHQLAFHIIVRFCGIEFANRAAKFWLIQDQGESQSPFSALSRGVPHEDAIVEDCQLWIANNYAKSNPVSRMAQRSRLPRATFARRFRRATGYRPMDYVHALRIEEAKELLERSAHAIEEIGREVGYEDPASFRRLFKRRTMLTPAAYRRQFGKVRFQRFDLAS